MRFFRAYIDESGDDGLKPGSSDWLVLTALIAPVESLPNLGRAALRIKERVRRQGRILHWGGLDHNRRKAVCEELRGEDFSFISVLVDKHHSRIISAGLQGKRLYFYTVRLLAERISWYVSQYDPPQPGKVDLVFENRSGLKYEELDAYLRFIQTQPDCQIRAGTIGRPKPVPKGRSALLQLCDSLAGATRAAFEFKYGTIEEGYLMVLSEHLYRRYGRVWGYGLKVMPYRPAEVPVILRSTYPWMDNV